ncbi:YALI0F05720p [Yarrowia lipolytica CLIB122]|uniref:YALI0F05720p n=1 Tax=Yarrowia lipolytica (strain CLIB 122 / E 150) TaxID=284591 RepID=Q6C2R7_YARLI|nr:YALI0F05720p [Yarrowia lipolytica CLIB122]CAG77852.1 YALI0F05720p [Yarrowia lipolytica CLIB122]|eukprot:XP_505045.1 YALI0F05720p [Yarrowia lipolytica CLIB122]
MRSWSRSSLMPSFWCPSSSSVALARLSAISASRVPSSFHLRSGWFLASTASSKSLPSLPPFLAASSFSLLKFSSFSLIASTSAEGTLAVTSVASIGGRAGTSYSSFFLGAGLGGFVHELTT